MNNIAIYGDKMKTMFEFCVKFLDCIEVNPDQEILHVMDRGQKHLEQPKLAKDMKCPSCGGTRGFYIPHGKTWSCFNEKCINRNAGKNSIKSHDFSLCSCYKCFPHLRKQEEDRRKGKFTQNTDYSNFGIDPSLSEASYSNCFQSHEIQYKLKNSIKDKKGIILLVGKNGVGKSYISVCAMKEFIENNKSCKFVTVPSLRLSWLDIKKSNESELGFLNSLCNCEFLVLDDMGLTTPTEAFFDFLFILLDKRHKSNLTTIVTTNLNSLEMTQKYGNAICSRLSSGVILKIEGPDRRKTWD